MNWRTTLILAVIALAGFAYFRFFEMKRPSTEEATRQAQNVVNFDRNKVDGIVIKNGDQQIEIRRRESKWRLETPIKDQADGALVDNLLSDLETWEKEGTIPAKDIEADKSKLAEYGLNNPKLKLKLLGRDKPPEIWFGKDAALEGRMYVRLQNSKETFLAKQSIRKDIDKKPEEFRDRRVTDLTTAQVRRITLKTPAGEMEMEKKGDHWDIIKPLRARADDGKVVDLIAQITTARIQQFVADDRGDLRPYGLAEPRGSITLFDEAEKKDQKVEIGESIKVFGREDKGQTLQIGSVPEMEDVASNLPKYGLDKPQTQLTFSSFASENTAETKAGEQPFAGIAFGKPEGDNVYARLTDEPFVVAVRRGLLDQISPDLLQWQELSIFKFKPEQIHRLSVTAEKELSLERDQNNQWHWLKGSGEINQANVQSLLNTLPGLRAVRWLGATTPQHGFGKPQVVLAFTTSPDNKTSHKLTIGAQNNDGTWCARVDGREGTFAISNSDLNTLRLPLEAQATASPPSTTTPVTSVAP